ncbi:hypothetical protein [Neoroseomonas oryzicola]|uniref:Uncharacterized protein n=1 Tax=Neoroseomonas oryzicola TaxID=535904 RepID=A0A9X9WP52_9PROT|nr:hypothetical protein [Neoroseomonas oryzicola]MBR0662112.1 hypothetical protein [Neoroseomonas oryzicola]NKE19266.1 hypothetical protein [Neoroseomonas oryzicola]
MDSWAPPKGFAGRWVLSCMAGLAIGAPLATLWGLSMRPSVLAMEAGRFGALLVVVRAVGGAIAGAALGAAQAWALRRAYPDLPAAAWIGVSAAAGFAVAVSSGLVIGALARHGGAMSIAGYVVVGAVLHGVLGGVLFGIGQARVLRAVTDRRGSWPLVVTLGIMLGTLVASLRWIFGLGAMGPVSLVAGAAFGGAVEGLALGLVTGGAFRVMPPRRAN